VPNIVHKMVLEFRSTAAEIFPPIPKL